MKKLIKAAHKFAYEEQEKTNMPIKKHMKLATEVGLNLAKKLNANAEIVEIGTLMMDCLIGKAIKEGRLNEHIQMSYDRTEKFLNSYSLKESLKENILYCIKEHHGVEKFHSIESEICCNADCYRFVSIKGFTYTIRYIREMEFSDLTELLDRKVEEKWNALSLEICKEELEPQYNIIKQFLKKLS